MVPFTGYNTRILNESSRKNIPDKIGMTARRSSVCHPPTGISHPQLWIGHFLYYIPYFLSTSLCNCNTNSYCDLCWYQWQPLGVVAFAALTPASPCRKDALHSPSSSRYYALLNQSCHCYCCLLAALPCPARFFDSFVRFMAARPDSLSLSLSLCLFLLGWFETSLGPLWILLIKQHRRTPPTKRRLTGVTRVSLFGVDERGKFARLPTLSAERKRVPPSDPGFLKRDKREGTALLIVPEGGLPLCHGFKNRAQHCRFARTN